MQSQLRAIQSDHSKGKSSREVSTTTDELQYLMDFNDSISQAMAKTMEHLSDFVLSSMANLNLARWDSYLSHLKTGIKPNTLAPLQMAMLYLDDVLERAEQDIANFESKGQTHSSKKGRYYPYKYPEKRSDTKKLDRPAW